MGVLFPQLRRTARLHPPPFAKSRGTLEPSIEEGRGGGGVGGGRGCVGRGSPPCFFSGNGCGLRPGLVHLLVHRHASLRGDKSHGVGLPGEVQGAE